MEQHEVLNPPAALLVKLASAIIYAENGHMEEFFYVVKGPDVDEWLNDMDKQGLLPERKS